MAAETFKVKVPTKSGASSTVSSLPPPCPKSPPEYPDLYGKRREMAKVQMLERQIGFLEEELKSVERLQPASKFCKEVTDFVLAKSDPLIPTNKKNRRSCRFWRWLCGIPCFNFSSICCCCYSGCFLRLKLPSCCDCNCDPCNCCSCIRCPRPKWRWCCSCSCSCPRSNFCKKTTCRCNCCKCGVPSCPDCSCCKCSCPDCSCSWSWLCCCPRWKCSTPKCPKCPSCPKCNNCTNCLKASHCSNCAKNCCCNPCCLLF